jgi:hypothetical protein
MIADKIINNNNKLKYNEKKKNLEFLNKNCKHGAYNAPLESFSRNGANWTKNMSNFAVNNV